MRTIFEPFEGRLSDDLQTRLVERREATLIEKAQVEEMVPVAMNENVLLLFAR